MTTTSILLILGVLWPAGLVAAHAPVATVASAQMGPTFRPAEESWAEAYRRGDYRRAADLLHPLVLEQLSDPNADDPTPARHLAGLYATGRGVRFDPIAACSIVLLSQTAASAASHRHLPDLAAYDASLRADAQLIAKHCDGLAERERLAAHRSLGCFAFGMPEQIVSLGQQLVWVGRGGIRLAEEADEKVDGLPGCPQIVARVRPLTVGPPAGAAKGVEPRHFIELLAWSRASKPGSPAGFALNLHLYELRGRTVEFVLLDELQFSHAWPASALPSDIEDGLNFEMTASGIVAWRSNGASPKSGRLPLPASR